MKQHLKILVVFNSAGTPPKDQLYWNVLADEENDDWDAERNVIRSLNRLGHTVRLLGIYDDITVLVDAIKQDRPDVVFNLTEHFHGIARYDKNVAGLLELLSIPYTGAGVTGLVICRDKGLTKKILNFHRIRVPQFAAFYRNHRVKYPKRLRFPLMIKPLREDASTGISQRSVVENEKDFYERVRYIYEGLKMDVIAEEYIDGRELYVGVIGTHRLTVLPIREMKFGQTPEEGPRVATYRAKWDVEYREKWGITNGFAGRLADKVPERIAEICKRAYRVLMLKGYGRFDIRLTDNNEVYIIEANPNPFLADYCEFAQAAEKAGIPYDTLMQRIIFDAFKDL